MFPDREEREIILSNFTNKGLCTAIIITFIVPKIAYLLIGF
jgi:hypothetical protein